MLYNTEIFSYGIITIPVNQTLLPSMSQITEVSRNFWMVGNMVMRFLYGIDFIMV